MAAQQQGGKAKRGGFQAGHSKRGSKTPNTPTTQAPSAAVPTPPAQNGVNNGRSTPSQASGTASSAPQSNNIASGGATPASAVSITPESTKQMKDRMHYLLVALVGQTVVVTLKGGAIYSGILAATTTDSELGLALKRVTCISNPDEPPKKTLLILAKDLLQVTAAAVNLEANTSAPATANGKDTFRTDVDISHNEESPAASGRQLRRWADEVEESEALESSARTFSRPTPVSASGNKNAWDQFATNERLFGAKTNYDEEMYTTKLDRSGKDFRERERKAAALAQQILSGSTTNVHLAEERGQMPTDSQGLDEEDKYSGVIRAPGAYVPPGARKPVENGSVVSPAPSAALPSQLPTDLPIKPSAETSAAAQANPEQGKDFLESFKQFVTGEKKRLQPKKAAATSKAKDDKLAEMIKFSQTFKLKTPVPTDLLPYLTKDEQKQKELLAGKSTNAEASTSKVSVATSGATIAASTSNTPQLREAALASRVASPAPSKVTAGASPATKKNLLPEIPSFSELKALKAAKAANAAVASKVEDWQARTTSPSNPTKLVNANAKAFNPNAMAFNPGASPSPKPVAPAVAPVPSTSQPVQPTAASQPHPFFGTKIIKKGAPSMHVKEDFSPFKRSDVPAASSISPSWSYTGKPYKNIFMPAAAPTPSEEQDIRRPPSSNASAPGMQLTPSQSAQMPPHHQLPPNMQPPPHMMNAPQGMPPQGYQMYYPPAPFRYNGPPMAGQYPPNSPGQPHMYQPPQQQYMNQMSFPGGPQGMYSPQNIPPPQPGFINPNYRHPSYSGGPNMYNGQQASPQPQHRQYDNTQQPHQSFSRRSSGAQGPNMMMTQQLPGAPMIPPPQQQQQQQPSQQK